MLLGATSPQHAEAAVEREVAVTVRSILSQPDDRLDYQSAADAFDKLIDPAADTAATDAMVERLVDAARQMAGPNPTDAYKLAAVRKAVYEAGPWNRDRAFAYDEADPLGQIAVNRLLSTYVRTRQGNCRSMPALFLIVADRLGLNVGLAAAPLHIFVRYTDRGGEAVNLETTSGGRPARLVWYRTNLPMSDLALSSGIYMRTLGKRESIALMATTVLDFLLENERYREAADVADAILAANPRDAYVMVKKGTALGGLMRTEFSERYASPALVPAPLRARYQALALENGKLFASAEAMGWEPTE